MKEEPRIGRYSPFPPHTVCDDCAALIHPMMKATHDRYHAIQNDWARAIAMLLVAHLDVKDRFDVGRNENNWSAEAFAEVVADLPEGDPRDE